MSSVRTMSAASLATSVPLQPMATPMSACLSAGASLTPSPVTATICPRGFGGALDRHAQLVLGRHAGEDDLAGERAAQGGVVHGVHLGPGDDARPRPADDPDAPGDALGRQPVVAGEHHDADAGAVAAGHRRPPPPAGAGRAWPGVRARSARAPRAPAPAARAAGGARVDAPTRRGAAGRPSGARQAPLGHSQDAQPPAGVVVDRLRRVGQRRPAERLLLPRQPDGRAEGEHLPRAALDVRHRPIRPRGGGWSSACAATRRAARAGGAARRRASSRSAPALRAATCSAASVGSPSTVQPDAPARRRRGSWRPRSRGVGGREEAGVRAQGPGDEQPAQVAVPGGDGSAPPGPARPARSRPR